MSLVGGSCAVSVPISLSASGGSREMQKVSIKRCLTSEDIAEIRLPEDSNTTQSACWKIIQEEEESGEDNSSSIFDTSKDALLNKVLETIWNRGIEYWNSGNDGMWKSECSDSTKGWKITVGEKETVKGYCDDRFTSSVDSDESSNLMFLEHSSDSNQNLRVCVSGNNCWTGSYNPQSLNTFSTKASDEWYELKFYQS
ncbi:hypothetical protein [Candidatus Mycoplasma haematominutum]|uniref:hypothetical protein n=1 Tax=Candidatus Mycoplasma haematominutum TaxID=209446 RepID=UPI00030865B7|nr:hypothetical protein [Candidatus Mycoplasma haematominutum]